MPKEHVPEQAVRARRLSDFADESPSIYDVPLPISEPYHPVAQLLLKDGGVFIPREVIVREAATKSYLVSPYGRARVPEMYIEAEEIELPSEMSRCTFNPVESGPSRRIERLSKGRIKWEDTWKRRGEDSNRRQLDSTIIAALQFACPDRHRHFETEWIQPHQVHECVADIEEHEIRSDLVIVTHPRMLRFMKTWPKNSVELFPRERYDVGLVGRPVDYRNSSYPSAEPAQRGWFDGMPIYSSTMCANDTLLVLSPEYAGFIFIEDSEPNAYIDFAACIVNDYAISGIRFHDGSPMYEMQKRPIYGGTGKIEGEEEVEVFVGGQRDDFKLSYSDNGWRCGWVELQKRPAYGARKPEDSIKITWDPNPPKKDDGPRVEVVEA